MGKAVDNDGAWGWDSHGDGGRKHPKGRKACLDQLVVGYVGRKVCGETRVN